jgi:hypothetical protein
MARRRSVAAGGEPLPPTEGVTAVVAKAYRGPKRGRELNVLEGDPLSSVSPFWRTSPGKKTIVAAIRLG